MTITPLNVILAALLAAALALHSDTLLYLIGPAGCMILIPALVIAVSVASFGENLKTSAAKTLCPLPGPPPPAGEGSALRAPLASVIAARIAYCEQLSLTETIMPDGTRQRSITAVGIREDVRARAATKQMPAGVEFQGWPPS